MKNDEMLNYLKKKFIVKVNPQITKDGLKKIKYHVGDVNKFIEIMD